MMKLNRILICLSLVSILLLTSCGRYGKLKRSLDGYTPPISPQSYTQAPVKKNGSDSPDAFAEQIQRLEKMKEKWRKSSKEQSSPWASEVGQEPEPSEDILKTSFTLPRLQSLVLRNNAAIRAARDRLKARIESFSQVSNLDRILRQYGAFTEDLMTKVGPMKGQEPVTMAFPYPGVLSLKSQVVRQEVKSASEDLRIAQREVINQAKKTYWNLVFNLQAQRITRETLELLDYLEQVAVTRYESGKTSFQDVLKIRISHATLAEDLISLGQERRNLEMKIRELANLSPDTSIGRPVKGSHNRKIPKLETLYETALENRQELARMRAEIGKMERMIEMSETMILPSYSLDFSIYRDQAVKTVGKSGEEGFKTTTAASRGAGIPKMPWYGTEDAYLRQTRLRLESMKSTLEDMKAKTVSMVQDSYLALDRAIRENRLYDDTVVALSKSVVDTSTREYETGKIPFADVIDSLRTWLKANMAGERKYADVGIAWANLEAAVGKPLAQIKK